jgi:pimeloyl-ACP methyl ester carboxylesterase
LVLPTVILPGYLAGAIAYRPLEIALDQLGFPAITVPLKPRDWLVTVGGRPVTPILAALESTVQAAMSQHRTSQVNVIGHSAGGWISRLFLGEQPYDGQVWNRHPVVKTLITLGTPHLSQEPWTKRNLDFVNHQYPGAFYDAVRYVCVAGKATQGKKGWRWADWFTYQSYQLTCGDGNCWGDGVIPIAAAHLAGAKNLILDGVMHAPRSASGSVIEHIWYGSPLPLQQWYSYLD